MTDSGIGSLLLEQEGMEADDLLCSRNERSRIPLAPDAMYQDIKTKGISVLA